MALSRLYQKHPDGEDDPTVSYLPTPKEIEEATARIQETWSKREEQERAGSNRTVRAVGAHGDGGVLDHARARKFLTRKRE